ncbi:MAG: LacI family DNA-binding transcriptional regulator [Caldilineaceae bacterium]
MKTNPTTIRIQEVARTAGVSVSTVSRVLNGKDDVAATTKAHVRRIIDELGYSSSLAAKGMRSHRTGVIGVVIFDLSLSFNIEIVRGIDQMVQSHSYDLMVYTSNRANHRDDPTWERKVVNQLNGRVVDGIIIVTPTTTTLPTHYPLVTIEPCDEGDFPAILGANREGTAVAVRYLIGLGHQRIGMIGGAARLLSARQRRQGYEEALHAAGLPVLAELYADGNYERETARVAARQLLTLPHPPTAILAANDQSAFAVLEVAASLGIAIPQALSVIGFDNTPESTYTIPPLTTVDQAIGNMGSHAAELLVALIEGKPVEKRLYELPTRLVVRDSCRPAPARSA